MRRCMHIVELDHGESGTHVLLRRRVLTAAAGGDPAGSTNRDAPPEPSPLAFDVTTISGPGRRIHASVQGPVDMTSVSRLGDALTEASRGGALALTIDLSAVTHLASPGVQLLHHHADAAGAAPRPNADSPSPHPSGLRLIAPPGTIAHHVLTLTGLDRYLIDPTNPHPGTSHG
jgi:hypothetical protein